jgi:hypothetical protein
MNNTIGPTVVGTPIKAATVQPRVGTGPCWMDEGGVRACDGEYPYCSTTEQGVNTFCTEAKTVTMQLLGLI